MAADPQQWPKQTFQRIETNRFTKIIETIENMVLLLLSRRAQRMYLGTTLEDESCSVEEELGPEVSQEPGLQAPFRLNHGLVQAKQDLRQPMF
jgi:hypothetical protein